jgi:hypothetical protein
MKKKAQPGTFKGRQGKTSTTPGDTGYRQPVPELPPGIAQSSLKNGRLGLLLKLLALILMVVTGLWVRLEDLQHWYAEPNKAFYERQPLLTALDGYYYLSLARDLLEGTYSSIDERRAVPDNPARPNPPPLISFAAAAFARIAPFSLNWVGVLLPPFLGMLIVLPLFALGCHFGGSVCGILTAFMGVLFPYYVYRSGLGWFDTDCLNVTFATACAFFFLKFGLTNHMRRHAYLLAGLLTFLLFLWWWDQTPEVVTIISLLPLAVAVAFFYRPSGRERRIFYGSFAVLVSVFLLWKGASVVTQFFNIIKSMFGYIAKESAGPFPNIGFSISEQVKPSLQSVIALSTGNALTFVPALSGFIWLAYRFPKQTLFLGSLAALSALAVFYARRFSIFFTPLCALGFAYGVCELWKRRDRFKFLTYVIPIVCAFMVWTILEINRAQVYWPKERPNLIAGMDLAARQTPADAVIWAWWDHGYSLNYWGRRATINDGSVHSGERTVYNGVPFAIDNERLAANWIRFIVAQGITGVQKVYRALDNDIERGFALIKQVLAAGPSEAEKILEETRLSPQESLQTVSDWMNFFFPQPSRPIFLFVDELLARTSYWWYWFGTWDIRRHDGVHSDYRVSDNLQEEGGRIAGRGGLEVDLRSGVANVGGQPVPIRAYTAWNGQTSFIQPFHRDAGVSFEAFLPGRFGALMLNDMADSVFNCLYLRHSLSEQYFRPLALYSPSFQLWEVRGDSWQEVRTE